VVRRIATRNGDERWVIERSFHEGDPTERDEVNTLDAARVQVRWIEGEVAIA